MNATASKTRQCLCSTFEFGQTVDLENGDVDFIGHDTGCGQTTTKIFAQGHDAKLASFLVKAEMAGLEIRQLIGGVVHTFPGAALTAISISDALGAKVQSMLDKAEAKKAAKDAKKATKQTVRAVAAAKAEVAPEPVVEELPVETSRPAKIKVGRWTYDAEIDLKTGEATYQPKGLWTGGMKSVAEGKYTEV